MQDSIFIRLWTYLSQGFLVLFSMSSVWSFSRNCFWESSRHSRCKSSRSSCWEPSLSSLQRSGVISGNLPEVSPENPQGIACGKTVELIGFSPVFFWKSFRNFWRNLYYGQWTWTMDKLLVLCFKKNGFNFSKNFKIN